jgi:hypothetical protein
MGFVPSVHGTITAPPRPQPLHGTLTAPPEPPAGTLTATPRAVPVSSSGQAPELPEDSAVAELSGLISSLGALSTQAASLPLTPPTLPGLPQQNYQRQATDYMQLSDDSNS